MGDRDYLSSFLFHLGKGLWKSVPVLGPIVEEVFYEQFKDELSGRVAGLSDADVKKLMSSLPQIDMELLDSRIEALSDENRLFAMQQMTYLLDCLKCDYERIDERLDDIGSKVAPVESIAEIVAGMAQKLGSEQAVRLALDEIASKREAWTRRISNSQRGLLASIPYRYVSIDSLWQLAQDLLPECGYKEFRLRLHELELLGLVQRYWDEDGKVWNYRKTDHVMEDAVVAK